MKKLFVILTALILASLTAAPMQAQEALTQAATNAPTQTGTQAAAVATEAASTSFQAVPLDTTALSVIVTANAGQLTQVAVIGSGVKDLYGFSPDSHTLAYDDLKGNAQFWDITAGKSVLTIPGADPGVDDNISPSHLTSDGKTLVVANRQGTAITTWDTATGKLLSTGNIENAPALPGSGLLSPDGKLFAKGILDMTNPQNFNIGLWDTATGKQLNKIKVSLSSSGDVIFSPDSKILASIFLGVPSYLVDTTTGKLIATFQLKGNSSAQTLASFSPDGKTLFLLNDGSVQIFDLKRKALTSLKVGIHGGAEPLFSPDGKLVVLSGGSQDATGPVTYLVSIVDVTTGKVIVPLKDFPNVQVDRTSFSPDGKLIAFFDNTNQVIQLWGVAGAK